VSQVPCAKVLRNASLALLLGLMPGCSPKRPLDRAGITLSPEKSWHAQSRTTWMVPGTPLAAWSGPDGSSLVVYRTLWVPAGSAEMLAEALANRLGNLPGAKLLVKRTETVAGRAAARLELVAPGTGGALAASGLGTPIELPDKPLEPTRQLTLVFPRSKDTIYLTWHMPEKSHDRIEPEIRTTLQTLSFEPSRDSAPGKQ
jgi:hypothetical protein